MCCFDARKLQEAVLYCLPPETLISIAPDRGDSVSVSPWYFPVLPFVTTQVETEGIMPSEISQKRKISCVLSYTWNLKKAFYLESRMVVAKS